MIEPATMTEFYAPGTKELGLGIAFVLAREGGQLTAERMAEVLGDFLQIPEEPRGRRHGRHPSYTEWTYALAWASTNLRTNQFMARNDSNNRGMCVLTEHGLELGRWAERIYGGENPELPDWVAAFLNPLFTRMARFLQGGKSRKPPDYELCRWVRYCYLLNRPATGVALFNLILEEQVEPSLFKQAERQARILKLRLEEEGKSNDEEGVVSAPAGNIDEFRTWMEASLPTGSQIQTLVRASQNTIQEYTEDGVVILSSRSGRESLVSWEELESAYRQLKTSGKVDHRELGGRGNFLCSLLARLPGAQVIPGQSAVRWVAPQGVPALADGS
jgi:hypothetical protein